MVQRVRKKDNRDMSDGKMVNRRGERRGGVYIGAFKRREAAIPETKALNQKA